VPDLARSARQQKPWASYDIVHTDNPEFERAFYGRTDASRPNRKPTAELLAGLINLAAELKQGELLFGMAGSRAFIGILGQALLGVSIRLFYEPIEAPSVAQTFHRQAQLVLKLVSLPGPTAAGSEVPAGLANSTTGELNGSHHQGVEHS